MIATVCPSLPFLRSGKRLLNFEGDYSRISEFELGRRMPPLKVLLSYARAARIPLEEIVDDEMGLTI
jgi:hypothetical protein